MLVSWQGFDEEMVGGSLLKSLVDFVVTREGITVAVSYVADEAVKGPQTREATEERSHPLILIPIGGSLGGSFQSKSKFSSLARMRAYVLDGQDIPQDFKVLLCVFSDILHELGHIRHHFNDQGQYQIDMERYEKDLEYRINKEDEAEALTTKWLRLLGFYDLFNDATKLN